MPLKCVFIDAGNTLLYEMPSRSAVYAAAAQAAGVRVTDEDMAARMQRAHQELPREIEGAFRYSDAWFEVYIERIFHRELGLPRAALGRVTEQLFARFSDPRSFRLFPGALELLDGLRALGLGIGIVSNWSPRLQHLLEGLGIAPRVDFVLASGLERCEKPEPQIFRRALRRAGVAPEEALHAGDHPEKDVAGARNAGIAGVLVEHAGQGAPSLSPRVGSLQELLRYVEEQCA